MRGPRRALGAATACGLVLVALPSFLLSRNGDERADKDQATGSTTLQSARTAVDGSWSNGRVEQHPELWQGLQAFLEIARVLQSPRCQNCHPVGDAPLQRDDGRPHAMQVTRGPEGRGVTAMKCSNCHMRTNNPQPHGPPGAPNWHLPPPQTPMVFEGRTPAELCRTIKDPAQNGGKDLEQLVHHLTADSLVLWGWNPGPGRTLPPLSQPEFARVVREWAEAGAPCPEGGDVAPSGESSGPTTRSARPSPGASPQTPDDAAESVVRGGAR
jgi:hypothetical protein